MMVREIATFALLFALGIGYIVWLDAGCELSGVMTREGKVCFEDLQTP